KREAVVMHTSEEDGEFPDGELVRRDAIEVADLLAGRADWERQVGQYIMHPGASRHDDAVRREHGAVCEKDARAGGCRLYSHYMDVLAQEAATGAEPVGQRQEAFGGVEHAA